MEKASGQQPALSVPSTPRPWSVTRAAGWARSSRTSRIRSGMAMPVLRVPRNVLPGVGRGGRCDGLDLPDHERSSSRSCCTVIPMTATAWSRRVPAGRCRTRGLVPAGRRERPRLVRLQPPGGMPTQNSMAQTRRGHRPTWIRGSDARKAIRSEGWRPTSSHVPPPRTRSWPAGPSGRDPRRSG